MLESITLLVLGAVVVTLTTILAPLGYAAGGYVTGWILSNMFKFAGEWVVSGAAALGLKLTLEQLPLLGAFLAFVGSFFKARQTNNNKAK